MEKFKKYENFEVDNQIHGKPKKKNSYLIIKIGILLVLIIIFQIIYIICIHSVIKDKNNDLLQVNFKKYLMENGNKKLYEELNENMLTKYSYDDELKNKEKEIKKKEEDIINYKHKSSYLLNNFSPTTETLVRIKEKNKKKKLKINELKSKLMNCGESFNSKIIDSMNEINSIESIINYNNITNFKLCYRGENKNYDFSEVYDKCNFDRDIPFLIIFQTEIYERFGIFISNKKENNAFVFSFNFGNKKEINIVDINNNQKKSFIFLINLIKDLKYNNENKDKDKDKDNMKELNINDLEIFHI